MSKVSMKSTKQEILDVVANLEAELKEARASKVTVADTQAAKVKEDKIKSAAKVIDMGILNPEIIKQFEDVTFAIEEATKQLAEIQGVEKAIIDAEAIVMAKDAIIAKRIADEEVKLAEIEAKAKEIIANRERDIAEKKAYYEELSADLKKAREREIEEYKYNKARDRKIEDDKWEDEKALRLKAITDKEAELDARQDAIYDAEVELKELRNAVDTLPDLVLKAKEEGKTEAEKQLAKEKAIETNAIKKNAEWEIKMANMEKDRAVEDLAKAQDKIAQLEAKLEAAYTSMNTLATTTVQSNGGVKVLEVGKDK